jgi:hypothetical protein
MLTNPAGLSKVSNSYDKFRQTVGEILGKEGFLAENLGWNQPLTGKHCGVKHRDMSWIL